jgi:protoporphyrinogen IX oxidase
MAYLYLKALHIIFIVTWFAGLFYVPRLFVYVIEANGRPEAERTVLQKQLLLMTSRLWYGITWPSAIITLIMGTSLLVWQPDFLKYPFMHVKLTLVVLLYGYHMSLQYILTQLKKGIVKFTSQQMRIWNEAATILLISIVFLIVVKTALSMAWGLAGLIVTTGLILLGIKLYKKNRKE